MSDDKELKPCPFCGGIVVIPRTNIGAMWQVECIFCEATGPEEKNKTDAVKAWNERAK